MTDIANKAHSLSANEALSFLSSKTEGLSEELVLKKRKEGGDNILALEKPYRRINVFFSQFKNPLTYILILAGALSFVVGEVADSQVIFLAVFVNAIIGFFQEDRANSALAKLRKIVEKTSIVIRGGRKREVSSANLVVGDIIVLQAGSVVPADARLIEANDLEVNEASLTGESMPIYKGVEAVDENAILADRCSMVYSGTNILSGHGLALVVAIGTMTEIGRISELVKKADSGPTPLQKRMIEVSRFLGLAALVVCLALIFIGLYHGLEILEIIISAIALAVAAVPEGLAMAVTVILAIGIKQIAKRKALTRKLLAAETLGSITVICSDKTGTLTEGKMRFSGLSVTKELEPLAYRIGLLCSDVIVDSKTGKASGSAIENSFLKEGLKLSYKREEFLKEEPRLAELPFKSSRKYMLSLHKKDQAYVLYEKGAGEIVLSKCAFYADKDGVKKMSAEKKKEIIAEYDKLTSTGLRVIALSCRDLKDVPFNSNSENKDWDSINREMVFVSLVSFKDSLRKEAIETIALCRRAGIRPIIITGDHKNTAASIARELGFDLRAGVIDGIELDRLSEIDLIDRVATVSVFARVSPNHKIRIVEALKARGEVVAMTGDGLNDSPALKAADIGICLGSGTEVAKETADMVLLDDNFSVIVSAIKQGRVIFDNIRKSLTYLISDSFSEIILIVGSIIAGTPLALLPTQILWINIMNDGLPNFSLAFEEGDDGIMDRKPIDRKDSVFNREMKAIIIWLGLIRDTALFFLFLYFFRHLDSLSWSVDYLRTLFFAILITKSLLAVFSLRSFTLPIYKIKQWRNPYLFGAVTTGFLLMFAAIYVEALSVFLKTEALAAKEWLLIFAIAFVNIIAIEMIKLFFHRKDRRLARLLSTNK